jgi:putative ABC transport system ATP-binding protein
MSDPVFHLSNVMLSLKGNAGSVDILRGISLDVQAGETIALIGPSGSGKSSLLMVMGGLEQATGGMVTALGQNLTTMSEDDLARFRRGRMGIVFQSFHLIPTMTAVENVATPLELAGDRAGPSRRALPRADVRGRTAARGAGARLRAAAADPAGR